MVSFKNIGSFYGQIFQQKCYLQLNCNSINCLFLWTDLSPNIFSSFPSPTSPTASSRTGGNSWPGKSSSIEGILTIFLDISTVASKNAKPLRSWSIFLKEQSNMSGCSSLSPRIEVLNWLTVKLSTQARELVPGWATPIILKHHSGSISSISWILRSQAHTAFSFGAGWEPRNSWGWVT